jgi:hypothetical protein
LVLVVIIVHHHLPQVGEEVVIEENRKSNFKINKNIMELAELLKGFVGTMVYSFL